MATSTRAPQVVLVCEACKSRNYKTRKSHQAQAGRLELKKYCPKCRVHQLHVESR